MSYVLHITGSEADAIARVWETTNTGDLPHTRVEAPR